jgi:hypothetical protein
MAGFPREQIERSLSEKGFELIVRDHRFYYFTYKGKRTSIRTKISTGSSYKEYGDELLSLIKTQLKFQTKAQLRSFVSCELTEAHYIEILKSQNYFRDPTLL